MLGFQYVVAKSRELSSALDRELLAASTRSIPFRSISNSSSVETAASNDHHVATEASTASSFIVRNEGHTFLRAWDKLHAETVMNHQKLMKSGQELDATLCQTRVMLQTQAASEQFLSQNFYLVSKVRQQLAGVRRLVLKLAKEAEEVENLLIERCEENVAQQNAEFAAKQQQELENFEASIAKESEGRKRELLERRRQKLASAFMNDLRTYQTLKSHHGDATAMEMLAVKEDKEKVTLDEVDLIITADSEQLDAFYDSASEQEEEEFNNLRLVTPPVPKELVEKEEEKSTDKENELVEENDVEWENTPERVEVSMGQKGDEISKLSKPLDVEQAKEVKSTDA
ncbi:unnamed protein product [Peronospora belbahrii]|uniref:Sorting nexin/Vps5-like C-terminal domain-containing protein n=1 Tax=Peronospora belbahrii TaxID=622444 RepID=A0ABN8CSE5_9STRA|nr:unnamed protein product [Peronospora belbahrii]